MYKSTVCGSTLICKNPPLSDGLIMLPCLSSEVISVTFLVICALGHERVSTVNTNPQLRALTIEHTSIFYCPIKATDYGVYILELL